jgi:hypothetical protein
MPTPPPSPVSPRNAAILAAEARFAAWSVRFVSLVMARAEGGDPAAMRLCLERVLPAGRLAPRDLGPDYDPANLRRVFGAIGAALRDGHINIRQASRLLDALGAPVRARPAVADVRAFAAIEADLAKTMASMGIDHVFTVPPATLAKLAGADSSIEHDLVRKPVPTPDQVRGRPFRDHAQTNKEKSP